MESSDTDVTRYLSWVAGERDMEELFALLAMWIDGEGVDTLIETLPPRLAGRLGDGCVVILDDALQGSGRVVRAWVDEGNAEELRAWGEGLALEPFYTGGDVVELSPRAGEPWGMGLGLKLEVGDGARAVVALLSWSRPFDAASRRLASRATRIIGATIKRARLAAMIREALTYAQSRAADLEQRMTLGRGAAHGLGEGVVTLDAAGRVMFANPSAAKILGLSVEAMHARDFHALVHPRASCCDHVDEGLCALELALASGADVRCHDDAFERADGARVAVVYTVSPMPGAVESRVIAIRDMSDYQKMHARLLLTDRMMAVGTLASGIAHEINNPLSFVDANLRFSLRALRQGEPEVGAVDEALSDALDGVERMRRIVDAMRAFSGGADDEVDWIDLEQCLNDAMTISAGEVGQVATMRRVGDALGQVRANTTRLTQVLVSLLLNVTHAFDEGEQGGEVVVRTRRQPDEAIVEVRDNGRGIAPEMLRQIFDPFFTTSPVGRGTGLGLFVARSLVDELGGQLECESVVGEGTCFTLRLPVNGRPRRR
ncbi:PAS domain-containing protein [Lujinxingia vulgaris]|uniref:histidine kinase n=1 Tax=Lujinxingia vulgaris TaxID=2600176 RepID=A0A5C6X9L9_9DELT|nr:ATP-binding protein [Lujinxingia vulgaris]TXD33970.1 PAS domain-containing protein [Lujinxingia vulgaris]